MGGMMVGTDSLRMNVSTQMIGGEVLVTEKLLSKYTQCFKYFKYFKSCVLWDCVPMEAASMPKEPILPL